MAHSFDFGKFSDLANNTLGDKMKHSLTRNPFSYTNKMTRTSNLDQPLPSLYKNYQGATNDRFNKAINIYQNAVFSTTDFSGAYLQKDGSPGKVM